MDFIPLVTDEYRFAFCAATSPFPNDVKHIIYKKALCIGGENIQPPSAPKKITPLARVMKVKGWKLKL